MSLIGASIHAQQLDFLDFFETRGSRGTAVGRTTFGGG